MKLFENYWFSKKMLYIILELWKKILLQNCIKYQHFQKAPKAGYSNNY